MGKYSLILALVACASSSQLTAQTQLPDATVGVPYVYDFEGDLSALQEIFQEAGIEFSLTTTISGTLPPGIGFSSGVFSGTPTTAGTYDFTVIERLVLVYQGQTLFDELFPEDVSMVVDGFAGLPLSAAPEALNFLLTSGSTAIASQSLSIVNRGSQTQSFTATSATGSGVPWLTVSPSSGSAAFGSTALSVNVNPSQLAPGTYSGSVSISFAPSGQTVAVAVVVTVSSGQKQIQLSQTGLRFQTVEGGGTPPAQSIAVLNGGLGSLTLNVSASALSGGQGWLSVSPASGTATSTSSQVLAVSVNPAGLTAGDYYGQIKVSAAGVDNSPQFASVVLNIAPAGTDLGVFVQPTGLIFVGQAGGTIPAGQIVTLRNPAPSQLMFSSSPTFGPGSSKITVQPPSGAVSSSSAVQLKVQPNISGLAAGVYTGDLGLYFSNGTVRHIVILVIVTPGSSVQSLEQPQVVPRAGGCTPTKLLPVFTQLGSSFATVAAWPTPIEATIVDDCGNFLKSGRVTASFSSGDPNLSLLSFQPGIWSATWQARSSATQVTISVQAQQDSPALQGSASIGGTLQPNPKTPAISAGGAVSAASFASHQPLAPGSFVSVFGDHLSEGLTQSSTLPLATQLGATQVTLGGQLLALQFAANGQVNAIIPYDVPVNTTQQVIVTNGPAISLPEPVIIAAAQPAVFTQDSSGKGAAIVAGVSPDGTQFVVSSSHPLSAGDVVVIYCAGLGPVDPPVQAGAAASLTNLSHTTSPVTVSIGGRDAKVQFSGLAPGFAGLYQVNAIVPSGITPGNAVSLVITEAGQQSAPVTVPVR